MACRNSLRPEPRSPATPKTSPRATSSEIGPKRPLEAEVLQLQTRRSSGWCPFLRLSLEGDNLLSDNGFGNTVFVQIRSVGTEDGRSVSQDSNLVSQRHHFIQEVADEQDRFVFPFESRRTVA